MKNKSLWLGYEIQTSSGPVLQPTQIHFWNESRFKTQKPEAPFYYKADALVGLTLIQLNKNLQNPFTTPKMNYSFAVDCWNNFEPHYELWVRAQPRVQALRENIKPVENKSVIESFEKNFSEGLSSALTKTGIDLGELTGIVKAIDFLETKTKTPLLYNFGLRFSKETVQNLQHLHSLLFNLRSLIAVDYNARVQDTAFDSVKMDSIADYLPKAEYVSNDAIIYWNFKEISNQIPAAANEKMAASFVNYSHNAVCLIESLPNRFLKGTVKEYLEDSLYLAQMDWLLGTDAGLLFRVREELYGIIEGYEKVFWPDLEGRSHEPANNLTVNCELKETDWDKQAA